MTPDVRRQTADKRPVSKQHVTDDTLDEAEREFLKPVARYLAVLREWAVERRLSEAGPHPPDQP
jgi:hypothetical protein